MLGIGVWVLVDMPDLGEYSSSMENIVISVISIGCVIFAVGFLGMHKYTMYA